MLNNTTAVLSLLKGMPLTVLVAMFAAPVLPISEVEIAAMIGINRKTARGHLRYLASLGLVNRNGRYEAWSLADGALQLPLPLVSLAAGGKGKSYPSLSSPSSSINEGLFGDLEGEEEARLAKGKSYPSRFADGEEKARKRGLIQAFQRAGIGMNMWEELAGYLWVTAEWVDAHAEYARRVREPTSYVIQRLRCGDAVPEMVTVDVCPDCGSGDFWVDGRCLVCAGLIKH